MGFYKDLMRQYHFQVVLSLREFNKNFINIVLNLFKYL